MLNFVHKRAGYRQIDVVFRHDDFGVRHLQILLLFILLTIAYALRVNLSIGIVAMVDKNSTNPHFEEFDWDERTQSIILSSFFWGYVVTQIPAGTLTHRYGPKILLFVSMSLCSILAVLMPFCAIIGGFPLVIANRVLQGLCQGFIFPSTHTLLSRWAPVSERGRLATYCYAGTQFGTVLMMSLSGILASSRFGWPSIFYCSGLAGILWSILWIFWGGNSPADHDSITIEEREFIETSLGNQDHSRKKITPWKDICTSVPMIALIIVHCSHNWGFWTLLTEMPTYMKNVLEFDIQQNAVLSALPYLCTFIISLIMSNISDSLINRNMLSRLASRKLFNTIGLWGPMCALLGLAYVPEENAGLAVSLLTLAVGINAGTNLGFMVNHIDLSPNHAGIMMGITNCAANIMSITAPLVVGFIITDATDSVQWRLVFIISAVIYFFGNLVFIFFAQADIQPWNNPQVDIAKKRDNDSNVVTIINSP